MNRQLMTRPGGLERVKLERYFVVPTPKAGRPVTWEDVSLPSQVFCTQLPASRREQEEVSTPVERAPSGVRPAPVFKSLKARLEPTGSLPPLGTVIDKYRLEALLGTGGFGAVYKATHLLLGVPVALKILLPDLVKRKPHVTKLLCTEARFIATLNHEKIVRVLDVTHTPEITYIVMEYVDGCGLDELIASRGQLPMRWLLGVCMDVSEGLEAAWKRGLVHRDVKPANIMLDLEGKAKLVDLGLAKQVPDPDLSYRASEPSRGFQRGSGTPLYMAPEQAQGASPDLRSDIYALGVTLYEGLTGALPPHPDSNQSVAKMLRALRSEVPLELALLVQRMLSRDPVNRPDGYKELHRQLRQIRRSLPKEESWPETRQATV